MTRFYSMLALAILLPIIQASQGGLSGGHPPPVNYKDNNYTGRKATGIGPKVRAPPANVYNDNFTGRKAINTGPKADKAPPANIYKDNIYTGQKSSGTGLKPSKTQPVNIYKDNKYTGRKSTGTVPKAAYKPSVLNKVNNYAPKRPSGPRYYFGGNFQGTCAQDGFYYRDDRSFVFCSNGNAYVQPCAPGTRNSDSTKYKPGYYYGYSHFCDVNLVDTGYGVRRFPHYPEHVPKSGRGFTGQRMYPNTPIKPRRSYPPKQPSRPVPPAKPQQGYAPPKPQNRYPPNPPQGRPQKVYSPKKESQPPPPRYPHVKAPQANLPVRPEPYQPASRPKYGKPFNLPQPEVVEYKAQPNA